MWVDCLSPPHSSSLSWVPLPPLPLFQDSSLQGATGHISVPSSPAPATGMSVLVVPRRKSESWNSPSRVLLSNFLSRVRLYHVLNLQLVSIGIAAWALLASGVLLRMSCRIQNEDPGPLLCSRGCQRWQRQRRTRRWPMQSSVEAGGDWKHGDVGSAQRQGPSELSPGRPLDRVWRSKVYVASDIEKRHSRKKAHLSQRQGSRCSR